jgi:hypothetical protein
MLKPMSWLDHLAGVPHSASGYMCKASGWFWLLSAEIGDLEIGEHDCSNINILTHLLV